MNRILEGLTVVSLVLVPLAQAQTSAASGTGRTVSEAVLARLSVEDTPGHELVQSKGLDEVVTPDSIQGVSFAAGQMITHEQADLVDGSGVVRGYGVWLAPTGEKLFSVYGYSIPPFQDVSMVPFEGSFQWIGGTGRLKDVQGSGTIEGQMTRDGRATYRWNGTYGQPK